MYRAAIGLHYVKCHSYVTTKRSEIYAHSLFHDITLSSLAEELLTQIRFNCVILTLLFIQARTNNKIPLLHLFLLIYLANDIELNPGQSNDILTIFELNIKSLRNKISYLSDIASDYDIVCVIESHLDDNVDTKELFIEGFYPNPIRKDRTAHGGGIVIYVSNKILVKRLTQLEVPSVESIFPEVTFPHY